MLAQLFTPLRFAADSYGYNDDEADEEINSDEDVENATKAALAPIVIPSLVKRELDSRAPAVDGSWERDSLFDASRGEIGLAWSIFKVRGTPDETLWPVSTLLLGDDLC